MKSTSILIAKAALFNEQGQVLLLRRSKSAPNRPEQPDLPGGALDAGESPDQAVAREIREEVGLTLTPEELILGYTSTVYYEGQSTIRFVYIAQVNSHVELKLSSEHDEFYWLPWDEMVERYNHPVYVLALQYLREHNLLPSGLHSKL